MRLVLFHTLLIVKKTTINWSVSVLSARVATHLKFIFEKDSCSSSSRSFSPKLLKEEVMEKFAMDYFQLRMNTHLVSGVALKLYIASITAVMMAHDDYMDRQQKLIFILDQSVG